MDNFENNYLIKKVKTDWDKLKKDEDIEKIVCKRNKLHKNIKKADWERAYIKESITLFSVNGISQRKFDIYIDIAKTITSIKENKISKTKEDIDYFSFGSMSNTNDSGKHISYSLNKKSKKSRSSGPIIIVSIFNNDNYITIDGNHRVSEAKNNGKNSIYAYELNGDFLIKNKLFETNYDQDLFQITLDYNEFRQEFLSLTNNMVPSISIIKSILHGMWYELQN